MAIIDPEGLFGGDRLAALSDKARLYWPWLYSACNGYARMELNPKAIIRRCFSSFAEPMTEQQLIIILSEYAENFLMMVYEFQGQQWIQFDTPAKLLPRHKSKKDEASPAPSGETRKSFEEGYLAWKKAKTLYLHGSAQNRQLFHANVRGIGIGVGVGVGEGGGIAPEAQPPIPPIEPTPAPPKPNAEYLSLIDCIVVAHPQSLARSIKFSDVTPAMRIPVIEAIKHEQSESGASPMDAAAWILSQVEMHARDVPVDQHRFIPKIEKYFKNRDYRAEAHHFAGQEKRNGAISKGDAALAVFRQSVEEERNRGGADNDGYTPSGNARRNGTKGLLN